MTTYVFNIKIDNIRAVFDSKIIDDLLQLGLGFGCKGAGTNSGGARKFIELGKIK